MADYAIFRAAKLKRGYGKQSIGRAIRHLEKHLQTADISRPELQQYDKQRVFCNDYKAAVNNAIKKHNQVSNKALRSDAAVAIEMIFTYSPEQENKISRKQFYNCIKQFYRENFQGCEIIRIDFHASESVSHFHCIALATTQDGKISARQYLGDKKHLSYLQDRFADICKPLGLTRGKRYTGQKNKPHHQTLKHYKEQQIKEIEQLQLLKKRVQAEISRELCR